MGHKDAAAIAGLGREPGQFLKAGDILNRKFRIERLIGEGGMGVVVSATHVMLEQPVAIKLLNSDDPESAARLTTEAKNAARLQSEHVARVKDVEIGDNGKPYIVMELLTGTDLDALLAERTRLRPHETVDYMLEALIGLSEAHARGIVHRDLKPSNLFLATVHDRQIIKILDFGVSKAMSTNQQLTGKGAVLGSPPYMSPEQVRAPKTLDHRSDIWSMGVVLYELMTGELPFLGDEVQETFAMILERKPAPFARHRVEAPAGLEAVVMRCLEKDRSRRYFDVGELAAALAPFAVRNARAVLEISHMLANPPDDPTTQITGFTPSHIRPKHLLEPTQTPSGVYIPNPTSADGPSTVIGNGSFVPHAETGLRRFVGVGALALAATALIAVSAFVVRSRIHGPHEASVAAAQQQSAPPPQTDALSPDSTQQQAMSPTPTYPSPPAVQQAQAQPQPQPQPQPQLQQPTPQAAPQAQPSSRTRRGGTPLRAPRTVPVTPAVRTPTPGPRPVPAAPPPATDLDPALLGRGSK